MVMRASAMDMMDSDIDVYFHLSEVHNATLVALCPWSAAPNMVEYTPRGFHRLSGKQQFS